MSPAPVHTRSRGAWAEDLALEYLSSQGLRGVDRNFNCKGGELDLVCLDGHRLIFVEVRFRRANALVSATQSITEAKQRRLRLAATLYLKTHREHAGRPCRFDVITVTGNGDIPEIDWIKDAFQDSD